MAEIWRINVYGQPAKSGQKNNLSLDDAYEWKEASIRLYKCTNWIALQNKTNLCTVTNVTPVILVFNPHDFIYI